MSKKRFSTDRQVAALKPANGTKRTDYHHTTEAGFICRVSAHCKTWVVSHMVKTGDQSKRRKVTLGVYPDVSLADALEKTKEIKSDARTKGLDIVGTKRERKAAPTIADIMDTYFKETPLADKGKAESMRISIKDIIPLIGAKKAIDLRRQDVKDLHRKILDRGASVAANRTVELLRRAFNCAHEEELIEINPFPNLKKIKTPESTRERILKNSEIATLWLAMEQESANMRDILRLLLLLGQRSTDTMSMSVADIDEDRKEWTVPAPSRSKNTKPNTLPLPQLAWEIIEPRLKNEKWVFPSTYNRTRPTSRGDGHSKSTKDARRRLREITGIEGWTGHDFRRTCRTIMSREKVKPHIAERVLGHVQGGVESIYDRFEYIEEKARALEKVDRAVRRIVGLDQISGRVFELQRAG
jgi:integrase